MAVEDAPPSVLLVDDEALVSRLYARAVQAMGFRTQFASNGLEALEQVAQEPPALIITDLNMPGLSGVGLVEKLVQHGDKTFPVILASGDDTVPVLLNGLAAGVDDFLVKGMPFAVFSERIRFWVDGPFRGLPRHIRAAALKTFSQLAPYGPPVKRLRAPADLLVDRARATMVDLLGEAGDGFGLREVDRIRFLGVLDQVLAILCRTNGLAHLRRPDAMVAVINRLPVFWRARILREDVPRLDSLIDEPTFRHAANSLGLHP
ncbi:response regulator [Parapedomonas caeni]